MNSNALEFKIHLRWKKMTFLSRTWVTSLVITSSYKLNGNKPLWGKGSQTWTRSPRSSRGWPRWLNHISGGSDSVGQDGPWEHLSLTRDQEMAVLLVQGPQLPQPLLYTPGCESGRGWLAAAAFCRMTMEHMHPQRLGLSWHSGKWFNNMTCKRGPTFCLIVCVLTPT